MNFKYILVSISRDKKSSPLIELASSMAREFDSTIHVVLAYEEEERNSVTEELQDSLKGETRIREFLVRLVANAFRKHQIEKVYESLLTGTPSEVLLNYANVHDIDLIILGEERASTPDRIINERISDTVMDQSNRAVLTVPL